MFLYFFKILAVRLIFAMCHKTHVLITLLVWNQEMMFYDWFPNVRTLWQVKRENKDWPSHIYIYFHPDKNRIERKEATFDVGQTTLTKEQTTTKQRSLTKAVQKELKIRWTCKQFQASLPTCHGHSTTVKYFWCPVIRKPDAFWIEDVTWTTDKNCVDERWWGFGHSIFL